MGVAAGFQICISRFALGRATDRWCGINLHGDGPQSAVVRGSTSQVPGEPTLVQISARDRGINVSWGDAPGRGSDVIDYVIQWERSTESLDDAQEANANKTDGALLLFYTITGLENGTSYVRVMGVNSNGRGVPSPWKSAIPVGSIGVRPAFPS